MGLDVFLNHKDGKSIELPSKKYPKHMFKIGYLRSSYNSGGINNYLNRKGCDDLYWVFQPDDRCEFVPNWEEAKSRIDIVIEQFTKAIKTWRGKYDVEFVGFNFIDLKNKDVSGYPKTEQEAQFNFGRQLGDQKNRDFGSFTCKSGSFYLGEALKVAAIMPGIGMFNQPGVYVMFEAEEANQHYLQALEITREMIEWVLKKKNPQAYGLHWSG